MEIYSPISKNKDLFKKNRLKAEQEAEERKEIRDAEPYFINVEVSHPQESLFSKVGKNLANKLKRIFEFEEA